MFVRTRLVASVGACFTVLVLAVLVTSSARAQGDAPTIPSPAELLETFVLADGYEIGCFASELDLPLHNPMAMDFDARGRLWIAVSPTYPQYDPGTPPDDKLLILWDADRDGRVDGHRVFLDGLLVPTGFAIDTDAVYVAQQPNLWRVTDTDGDDIADRREVILHGFGTEDSHHSISAFTWGPGGGFYFNEGVFHHTQVETPWGPRRARDAAVFRYSPTTRRFEVASHHGYANPWGHAFDAWGQSVLSDASGGAHYNFAQVIPAFDYPQKNLATASFFNRGRPMAGNLILHSRHFPDDVQGTHLNNQSIGFHGVRWDRLIESGSGWRAEPLPNLLQSSNPCFRPVAAKIGPDGALYILDFANPIIGHMQYTHRDPRRDHRHGRVWRITHRDRPLLEPRPIVGEPIASLIAALDEPELTTRHFARRELQSRRDPEVLPAVERHVASLADGAPEKERWSLEALWIYQGRGVANLDALDRALAASDPRVRAGAVRVLRHWIESDRVSDVDARGRLRPLARDPNARVRLEVVGACGFILDRHSAAIVERVTELPADANLRAVIRQTERVLAKVTEPELHRLTQLARAEFEALPFDDSVATIALLRPDSEAAHRDRAFAWLTKEAERDAAPLLVSALERTSALAGTPTHLGRLLRALPRDQLTPVVDRLMRLATETDDREVRAEALATVVAADRSIARPASSPTLREDLLRSVTRLTDPEVLRAIHPEVAAWLPTDGAAATPPVARFVRIELPRAGILSLAEVEVFADGENAALGQPTRQSSEAWGGAPSRAVDGDPNGIYSQGSVTHTREPDAEPWWEVDLGEAIAVDSVRVWNRTEGRLGERLAGFRVRLLDVDRREVWARGDQPAPESSVELSTTDRPSRDIQLAAISVVAALPVEREETFAHFERLASSGDEEIERAIREALRHVPRDEWPAGFEALADDPVDPARFQRGREIYESEIGCITCHGASGYGILGSYPPLVKSPWVLEDERRLIRIVLHGLQGPIEVRGLPYDGQMEPRGKLLDDQQVADVLTYVRNAWGNQAPPIDPDLVAEVRQQHAGRLEPWTVRTLELADRGEDAGPTRGAAASNSTSGESTFDLFRWVSFGAGMALIFGPLVLLLVLTRKRRG